MKHTDWETLIPPIDRAQIPLVPSGDYPESATAVDKAAHVAANLVKRAAVEGTRDAYPWTQSPAWEQLLEETIVDIVGGQLMPSLKANPQHTEGLDWEELVVVAARAIRLELISRLARDEREHLRRLRGPRNPDGNPLLGRGIWSVRPIRAG